MTQDDVKRRDIGNDSSPLLPWCAKCNKPVERIEAYDSFKEISRVFKVYCHGETEVTKLGRDILVWASGFGGDRCIEMGIAFQDVKELDETNS